MVYNYFMVTVFMFFKPFVMLLFLWGIFLASTSVNAYQWTESYGYTQATESFTVPPGVHEVRVTACGASGGGDVAGGCIQALINVSQGMLLLIDVGGSGSMNTIGGYNGGGDGGTYNLNGVIYKGGGGGGATTIKTSNGTYLLAAGGGGGDSSQSSRPGGEGGSEVGGSGQTAGSGTGGGGGGILSGGSGGGSFITGGTGSSAAGGGGGGWYGGGGGSGSSSGGGGGSSYATGIIYYNNRGDSTGALLTIEYDNGGDPSLAPTSAPSKEPSGQPTSQPTKDLSFKKHVKDEIDNILSSVKEKLIGVQNSGRNALKSIRKAIRPHKYREEI